MLRRDSRKPRFRIILPITYLIIGASLHIICFLNIGHSSFCRYALRSTFPASLISNISRLVTVTGLVERGSQFDKVLEDLVVPLSFLLACFQYYLIGIVIDKLLTKRRPATE